MYLLTAKPHSEVAGHRTFAAGSKELLVETSCIRVATKDTAVNIYIKMLRNIIMCDEKLLLPTFSLVWFQPTSSSRWCPASPTTYLYKISPNITNIT